MNNITNKECANAIRFLSIAMTNKAKSGHLGMPLGMADVGMVLYSNHLKFNPNDATWFNRDRLVLSAGHGSAWLYSILYLTGYLQMTLDELKNFRQLGSKTPGHTEYDPSLSIEATTGPLGQGIAMAVGMALSERILNAKFSNELVNHKTYVICGDGCLAEGIGQEAISIAGHYKLNNLIILFDDNGITIDGPTSLATSENHIKRFKAAGWNAVSIDGHDVNAIDEAIRSAKLSDKPTLIACKTIIGYGASDIAGTNEAHSGMLNDQATLKTRQNLNWSYSEFEIPQEIIDKWRSFWIRNKKDYEAWTSNFKTNGSKLDEYLKNENLSNIDTVLIELKSYFAEHLNSEATRVSSGKVLSTLTKQLPNLVGGSADLTLSNNTKSLNQRDISSNNYHGEYIYYGEREHVMAAMMNGIALHGALIPYGGTFFSFADYARPAIRLSALMKLRVIYIMTHDSIGVGEDGPTHQPVEHLASFRAMPNIYIFRPCNALETLEAWEIAIRSCQTPSILVLTRQVVSQVTRDAGINLVSYGAYIIKEYNQDNDLKVTIFSTGSEVEIAIATAKVLETEGFGTRVVSVPCMELLWQQDTEYQMMLTCNNSIKVAIEAGCSFGWERLIGSHGMFFGVNSFGYSAPTKDLYEHFGLTDAYISDKILSVLRRD